ncbi:2,5-diamino-6-(ribosylamino)-4(3H)-pyrimidinone 5'-phosphate reductase [Thermocatellispora tengchongensis]|uniref:2,5-diamino-6-(Ribosylamino)-4(3H)-pyrimidinone 5'-phosphate reductase n=1 Tax=Thermocatellispora tengchongensis TaxID=1073253 RepID=A0A840NVW4_9ACTN|nr:dihydrofolate reductase family protein [Thermocatellispora tengchongensis]MBB5132944.1 2,5-diamino-6-(ribosylamino)-4(3H)-pyrimidinone 5'-phosphate reductase [Thermocatellispora tengchongensis]
MDGGARPYVVAHVAVSLEGATTGFAPDAGRFYEPAATWNEDATLAGADTILAQEPTPAGASGPGPASGGPLLAVVDGRARVSAWAALRDAGHWSRVLALRAGSIPPRPASLAWVPELVAGGERVDLEAALRALAEREGARVVRVDSGGGLVGALLARGLVDEVSLLVHPVLAGPGGDRRWPGAAPPAAGLELLASRTFDGGLAWLRYRMAR